MKSKLFSRFNFLHCNLMSSKLFVNVSSMYKCLESSANLPPNNLVDSLPTKLPLNIFFNGRF